MLIRPTTDSSYECITQEHHAIISGVLAAAWGPSRLDPLLVQAIGLHDNPWRDADAHPVFDDNRGLPHDFITYPMDDKIALYRRGLDALEEVHPWIAHLVSRHYSTFSGTRDVDHLTGPEKARRMRLEKIIDDRHLELSDQALEWVKFFDIFSLHLCLTGPRTQPESIPRWLTNPDAWSTAPDGTNFQLRWQDDATLRVTPWPFFLDALTLEVYLRSLPAPAPHQSSFQVWWQTAKLERRTVQLVD